MSLLLALLGGGAGTPVTVAAPGLAGAPALSAKGVGAAKAGAQVAASPAISTKGTGQASIAAPGLSGSPTLAGRAAGAAQARGELAAAGAVQVTARGQARVGVQLAAGPSLAASFPGTGVVVASPGLAGAGALSASASGAAAADGRLAGAGSLAAAGPVAVQGGGIGFRAGERYWSHPKRPAPVTVPAAALAGRPTLSVSAVAETADPSQEEIALALAAYYATYYPRRA